MVLNIYTKFMRKKLIAGLIPGLLMLLLGYYMAMIWPGMESGLEAFNALLESPLYKGIMGSGAIELGMTTFTGAFALMVGFYMLLLILILGMFNGTKIVTSEINRETMDMTLSYPIPRWRLLLEKFAIINTFSVVFLLFAGLGAIAGCVTAGIEADLFPIWNALGATWFLFYAVYAISLLCGVIFLKPGRALMAAGSILIAFLIMDRLGGAVESTEWVKDLSLFSLLDFASIVALETIPFIEVIIVFSVGTTCLVCALVIFEHRQITY